MSERGRDVVGFLDRNSNAVDSWEQLRHGTLGQWLAASRYWNQRNRRNSTALKQFLALSRSRKLTVERYFQIEAWRRDLILLPGFLGDSDQCDEVRS
jgi:hypothetical protein